MLAIIAPGQGAQTPGMLTNWLKDSAIKNLVNDWSNNIDLDLFHLGTSGTADEIKDTANAQPLIVAASLIGANALALTNIDFVSGHSVGEISAACLSGVITQSDAIKLVHLRGIEMAKAAKSIHSGMSAILGGQRDEVLASLKELGLIPANENGGGQIVAAGELTALFKLSENPPTGARIRPLAVAGAFHTNFMQPAIKPLSDLISSMTLSSVTIPVVSNKDGHLLSDSGEILSRIVDQIVNPVRWDLCMVRLKLLGVTGVIELPPAGTLVGLIKRATPEIETFALKSIDDLELARVFAERHA